MVYNITDGHTVSVWTSHQDGNAKPALTIWSIFCGWILSMQVKCKMVRIIWYKTTRSQVKCVKLLTCLNPFWPPAGKVSTSASAKGATQTHWWHHVRLLLTSPLTSIRTFQVSLSALLRSLPATWRRTGENQASFYYSSDTVCDHAIPWRLSDRFHDRHL